MREIRTSGSEGGGTGTTGPPYPYIPVAPAGLNQLQPPCNATYYPMNELSSVPSGPRGRAVCSGPLPECLYCGRVVGVVRAFRIVDPLGRCLDGGFDLVRLVRKWL
jgi:hypothetical protein